MVQTDSENNDLVGSKAIDANGTKIGMVTDVVHDPESGRPEWAVIDPGLLKAEHYAPLGEAYRSSTDDLVLDLDKRFVTSAPKAPRDHEITPQLEEELHHYYDRT